MLAGISDAQVFKTVWRAESTDGLNWTWYVSGSANSSQTENLTTTDTSTAYAITSVWSASPFMQETSRSTSVYLFNPILTSANPATNNADWWGFFNYGPGLQVGAMKVEWGTGSPVIKIVTGTSPSWTYTTATGGNFGVTTAAQIYSNTHVKTLLEESGVYTVWGYSLVSTYGINVSCNTNTLIQCTQPGGCGTGDGSMVSYLAYGRPFWLNTGPAGDVSCPTCTGSNIVYATATPTSASSLNWTYSNLRAMPSGYPQARMYPSSWNSSAGRYLFSATNDASICTQFLYNPLVYVQVVKSLVVP